MLAITVVPCLPVVVVFVGVTDMLLVLVGLYEGIDDQPFVRRSFDLPRNGMSCRTLVQLVHPIVENCEFCLHRRSCCGGVAIFRRERPFATDIVHPFPFHRPTDHHLCDRSDRCSRKRQGGRHCKHRKRKMNQASANNGE